MREIIEVVTIKIRIKLQFCGLADNRLTKNIDPTPEEVRLENRLGFLKRYIILHGTVQWSSLILVIINYFPSFNLGTVFVPCSTMSHFSKNIYRRWSDWFCSICAMLLTGENGGTPRKTWTTSTLSTTNPTRTCLEWNPDLDDWAHEVSPPMLSFKRQIFLGD